MPEWNEGVARIGAIRRKQWECTAKPASHWLIFFTLSLVDCFTLSLVKHVPIWAMNDWLSLIPIWAMNY